MPVNPPPIRANFGLLPEPQRSPASFVTSAIINLLIVALAIYIGIAAKRVIMTHTFEQTELLFPTAPPPPVHIKLPPLPKIPPKPEVKMEAPKINLPKPAPQMKPLHMESRVVTPHFKASRPQVVLAPQPHAALRAAAPAQVAQRRPSTERVHFGETFGVRPNPNATRPATVAAIGNPYGGMEGRAEAPRGVVGSVGIGNGTHSGSNYGTTGRVAQAGIPGGTGRGYGNSAYGNDRVGRTGIPGMQRASAATPSEGYNEPRSTNLEVLSKPPIRYTAEARAEKIQGDVVLRVTFTASGQVVVHGVVHGLGYGLDEEAQREATRIRFRPATRNGQPVDLTTNITITFQLA